MTETFPGMRHNLVGEMYMVLHYGGNHNLNILVKKIPMIILGIILISILMPSALAAPRANLQVQGTEWYRSDTSDLYPGTYPAQYSGSVSILNYPDTGTILGNITYRIDAENITSYNDMQYATRNGSSIQWVFPENITLPENTYIITGFRSDYYNNRHIPITVHRSFNKTVFSSDGYQRASFSVAFENFSYTMDNVSLDKVWGGITTHDNSEVNASIVAGSFTTDMPIWRDPQNNPQKITGHLIEFGNDSQFLQEHQVYNFSVLIHVHRKNPGGPPIEYYPTFSIALQGGKVDLDSLPNFTAIAPTSLLPKYMHYASGSTNVSNQWTYSRTAMLGFALNSTTRISGNNSVANSGVFRSSTHLFYLDYNGNGVWNGASVDRQYNFGITGDIPVTGDWNSDGKTEIGVFRNSTHLFYLDYNGNGVWNGASVDRQYNFGISGDIPVSGDWNNDGTFEIGVFRPSTHLFYLDYNGNGAWNGASVDRQYNFGITGDIPVSGDWNNDKKSKIGVFRPSTHLFYLDYNGNGAWNGGAVDRSFNFGITGDIPLSADWNDDGKSDIGVFRNSTHLFYLDYNGNGVWNGASVDRQYNFGITGDTPVTGKW